MGCAILVGSNKACMNITTYNLYYVKLSRYLECLVITLSILKVFTLRLAKFFKLDKHFDQQTI
ncbi:hypothetical protein PA25_16280 [Pseudoalteromonas sp. A25]|nr:hypothetical protein PA25_16280 [Pseudoalteromonas sp. A25]